MTESVLIRKTSQSMHIYISQNLCVFVCMFERISYVFQQTSPKFDTNNANGPVEVLAASKLDLTQYLSRYYRLFDFRSGARVCN